MPTTSVLAEALILLKDAASGVANLTKLDQTSGALLDILIDDRTLPAPVRVYLEIQEVRRGFHNQRRIAGLLASYGKTYEPFPRRRRTRPRSRKGAKSNQ